jgi:hypothetical protein
MIWPAAADTTESCIQAAVIAGKSCPELIQRHLHLPVSRQGTGLLSLFEEGCRQRLSSDYFFQQHRQRRVLRCESGENVSREISLIVAMASAATVRPKSVRSIAARRRSRGSTMPRVFNRLITSVMVAES